jgi:hypothetical protein
LAISRWLRHLVSGSGSALLSAALLVVLGACDREEADSASEPVRLAIVVAPPDRADSGEPLNPVPAVQLQDAAGRPVRRAGTLISASLAEHNGALSGPVVQETDVSGQVFFSNLSIAGPGGSYTLVFTCPGTSTARATIVLAAGVAYTVDLRYLTSVTTMQALAFEHAIARIGAVVTGDIPDAYVTVGAIRECGNTPIAEVVDDLLIWVVVRPIDGPEGILGQAGPCLVRSSSGLPMVGVMLFDSADLEMLEEAGQLEAVILHEMLHVVGFGTIWSERGLLSGAMTLDPIFTGAAALDAFVNNDGTAYQGNAVPVENTGGTATRDGHWRESVFSHELMTGWISGAAQPLSRTTIASLSDIGYTVDVSEAEPLTPTAALRNDFDGVGVHLGNDILESPAQAVPGT